MIYTANIKKKILQCLKHIINKINNILKNVKGLRNLKSNDHSIKHTIHKMPR